MTDDTYIINGVDLRTVATDIETAEGLQTTPAWEGDDLDVAGWHGRLDVHAAPGQQRRAFGPGSWSVRMRVLGVDPVTGLPPTDPEDLAFYLANVDRLTRLFHARTLTIVHPRDDGGRQAVGHLAGRPLDFTRQPSSPWYGQFLAEVTLPDPFWYEAVPVTATAALATGGPLSLAVFAKATAPMRAVTVELGPGSNPVLTHAGTYLSWASAISAGRRLGVACDPRDPSLYAAAGTWTPSYLPLGYGPGPSWFEIDPTTPTATLTHTGGGVMDVAVSARIAHLTS